MTLRVHGVYNPKIRGPGKPPHQKAALECFAEGMKRHNVAFTLSTEHQDADLTVHWGWRMRPASGDHLVLENGYIGDTISAGFNGLNGRADFLNDSVPDDRGKRLYHLLKPYSLGDYVLIMGQVPGDYSIQGVDFDGWAKEACKAVRRYTGKDIYFRPHPLGPRSVGLEECPHKLLDDALAHAHWVITYNSSSAVEAALAGCPVVACDLGSMAWDVASHDYTYKIPGDSCRKRWLDRLAYCQWTREEIANGDAWDHLKARYM